MRWDNYTPKAVRKLREKGPLFRNEVKAPHDCHRLRAYGIRRYRSVGRMSGHCRHGWPQFVIYFLPGQEREAYERIVERFGEPYTWQKREAALVFGPEVVYTSNHSHYGIKSRVEE